MKTGFSISVGTPTAARQCRDFRCRIGSFLSLQTTNFSSLFPSVSLPCAPDDRLYDSCAELMADVKLFLSTDLASGQEIQMAFQSLKKLLPASCGCMDGPLIHKVSRVFSSPAPRLPSGYLKHVRRVTRKLFPSGINQRTYAEHCETTVPPLSGCMGSLRSDGGVLGSDIDHASFLDVVFGHSSYQPDDYVAELTVVQSAGKPRALSKQPPESLCLRPLHKALYAQLSRKKWLHKGDVTRESLLRAGFTSPPPGHTYTSGDYKAATDGLSIEVAETILGTILEVSGSVPDSIKEYAMKSLRPNLFSLPHDIDFRATRGQQMGSYLSFPLLCLQNYMAYRYALEKSGLDWRKVPVSINGDDILFCSTPAFSSQWQLWMSDLSLEVETSKTSVSPKYGSLNSTLVAPCGDLLVVVPTVRFGMLAPLGIEDLAGVFRDFMSGLRGNVRFRAAHLFFRCHIGALRGTCYTTYELGFRGRLAERMTERFGLKCGGGWCAKPLVLPTRFVAHNVTLSSDSVTWVPTEELTGDEQRWCARELASWRFSVPWSRAVFGEIRYLVSVTMARPDEPCFEDFLRSFKWRVLAPTDWQGVWRRMMRSSSPVVVKKTPVVHKLWDAILADRPPPVYTEYEEGLTLVEVVKEGRDTKGKK